MLEKESCITVILTEIMAIFKLNNWPMLLKKIKFFEENDLIFTELFLESF